ncbi:MAG: hypothetical protein U1D41_03415 [Nitrosomonas sp.]|uniref:hypothetical protein n=1 Tax=Nitrosomonas sp. TaxID=42353 RepID=UPI00271992CF|nr:hypothetical protein [Nitrosomonas sp.]MDO8993158.1 hypothetical protein [Daejeonella sp.]MDP3279727.1 hypothetical protein [Nitrosomonas sp.]MDP3664744.1 hypothetical protein [Nitrosomonas sp.]MDZ4105205.1 hypothetical protein [Nitrosomonas sp.]
MKKIEITNRNLSHVGVTQKNFSYFKNLVSLLHVNLSVDERNNEINNKLMEIYFGVRNEGRTQAGDRGGFIFSNIIQETECDIQFDHIVKQTYFAKPVSRDFLDERLKCYRSRLDHASDGAYKDWCINMKDIYLPNLYQHGLLKANYDFRIEMYKSFAGAYLQQIENSPVGKSIKSLIRIRDII